MFHRQPFKFVCFNFYILRCIIAASASSIKYYDDALYQAMRF